MELHLCSPTVPLHALSIYLLLFAGAATERTCRLPVVCTGVRCYSIHSAKHTNKHVHAYNPPNKCCSMKNHIFILKREVLIIGAFRKRVSSQLCYSMRGLCVLRAQGAGFLHMSVLVLLHQMQRPKTDPFN